MSDPRDELLDRILLELYQVRHFTDAAWSKYARDPTGAIVECQWAYAAGRCRAIAEQLLQELEQHKRSRTKAGSG